MEDKLKSCTYNVDGMHCAACEVLIEKKLLEQKGIKSADVSLNNRKVKITYSKNQPNLEKLNEIFKEDNYSFYESDNKEDDLPLFKFQEGDIYFNKSKVKNLLWILGIFILVIILFLGLEKTGISGLISVSSSSSLPVFFLFGLLAGASSCAALVGGLLLSLSKKWNELYTHEDSNLKRSQPFIMFNIGRVISFALLGGVLGLVGSIFGMNFNGGEFSLTSILVLGISFMMIFLGLQMLGVEWATKVQLRLPKFIGRRAAQDKVNGRYMPFVSGFLTFFLPCGFTLIAQGIALTSGSFVNGSLIMFFFALGTLPMLALISIGSLKFNENKKLRLNFNKIAGLLVLFFAIYNINAQLNVLGLWSLSDLNFNFGGSETSTIVNTPPMLVQNGSEQKISIIAKGFEYKANGPTVIQSGVKTILEIDNQGIYGCGVYLAARGLINNYIQLKSGINKVEFVAQNKGTYKITCSMGMVAPVVVTVV